MKKKVAEMFFFNQNYFIEGITKYY